MGVDVFFVLMGAILVFAMHAGFAFLEVGTVREKNQVNALVKIIADFAVSVTAYFVIGYLIAYGTGFFSSATELVAYADASGQGFGLVKFFFLATFAAAIAAIVSGGIAERMRFVPPDHRRRRPHCPCLPLLRRHRLERQLRHPGMAHRYVR
jgi:Amt family ammonium transporter